MDTLDGRVDKFFSEASKAKPEVREAEYQKIKEVGVYVSPVFSTV